MERPRLTIDVTPKQSNFLQSLPFGWKRYIFSALIDMLMETVDRRGPGILGIIASKRIKIEDYFDPDGEIKK